MFNDMGSIDGKKMRRRGRKGVAAFGLAIGRQTDMLFRDIVKKKVRLDPTNSRHRRCHSMFAALEKRGVKCVRVQFPVAIPHLGIKTELDGLGVSSDGAVVVIELKTTQHGMDRHNLLYKRPCQKRPKMSTGLPNTEYIAHQMQTAFGMLAMRSKLPPGTRIQGLVVVCTNDGARIYDVEQRFVQEHLFKGAPSEIKAIEGMFASTTKGTSTTPVSFTRMPTSKPAEAAILKAVARLGYTSIDTRRGARYGSFVARNAKTAKMATSLLIVALVYVKTPEAKMGHRKYAQLLLDARSLWIAAKKKVTVRSCVFYYCEHKITEDDSLFKTEMVGSTHFAVTAPPPQKKRLQNNKRKKGAGAKKRTHS